MTNKGIGEEFGVSYLAVSKAASDVERLMGEDGRVRANVNAMISHFKV